MSEEPSTRITRPILAILGPEGTYSHQAAFQYFGEAVEYRPCQSISDAFHSISLDASYAMIPLANSTHGMVIETYDLLRSERVPCDFSIVGDTIIKIEHCLVVSGSGDQAEEVHTHPAPQESAQVTTTAREEEYLKNVNAVYSHEQALGQCVGWLNQNLPNAKRVPVSSTAAAAKMLTQSLIYHTTTPFSSNKEPTTGYIRAAIASEICLSLYPELRLVRKGIQDDKRNQTRFILISKSSSPPPRTLTTPSLLSRAILRIPVAHSAGSSNALLALDRILQTITSVTDPPLIRRIERRPSIHGGAWDDIYFIDLEERPENRQNSRQAKEESRWESRIRDVCVRIRDIGGIVDILGIW